MPGVRPNSPIQTISVLVQQAALAQVAIRRRPGGIEDVAQAANLLEVVVVRVPAAERHLDERHAALDQPAGQQTSLAERCCGRSDRARDAGS